MGTPPDLAPAVDRTLMVVAANAQTGRILVVDDDPASARFLAEQLESFGHTVSVAHTWTDAIRQFGHGEHDLIMMDAVMPTVDGFKLTKILRRRSSGYVPVVFVTSLDNQRARERGLAAGADDMLSKPVDDLELRMRVTAMLRIRGLTAELEAKHARLAALAHSDALTGLGNRRSFDQQLAEELRRAARYNRRVGIIVADIDKFKLVNDNLGHAVGDELLRCLGGLLDREVRAPDSAFRYGGEEFVIITPETDAAGAANLADRLRRAFTVAARTTSAGAQSISMGVADSEMLEDPEDGGRLFELADQALYRAKVLGRDRVEISDGLDESERTIA